MSKKYRVTANEHSPLHGFNVGEIVTIIKRDPYGNSFYINNNGLEQWVSDKDVEPVNRSLIDIVKGWFIHA